MKYLKLFWTTLREFISNIFGFSSKTLNENDQIGRFLTSSSHYSETKGRVKYSALMPMLNEKSDKYETSVFNVQNLSNGEKEQLATKYILVHLPSGRSIYGTGQFQKTDANNSNLRLSVSEPPPKHLNIIDWPNEKSERMLRAKELAKKCNLVLFNNKLKA